MSVGKSDPPPAPDYTGAAVATAAGNADAARIAAKANRVDQYSPYGAITYTSGIGGDQDRWRMDTSLSPLGQQAFDSNQRISAGLGNLAESGLGYVQNTLNKPFDWSAIPQAPVNAGTTAQQAIMARLNPQIDRQREALQTQLANQGIASGTEAYNRDYSLQNQRENDLLSQAALQGIGLDTAARANAIQEQSFARNEPLNMLNAVRSGAQTQLPQFQNVPGQTAVPGPNYLGAAQASGDYATDQYNAQQAQQSNMMGGLLNLGTSAMMGGFSPFSFGGSAGAFGNPFLSQFPGGRL
jgi:hypothetical protein